MSPVRNGIEVGPNSPLLERLRGCRAEKAEAQLCDDFISRAPRGGVVNLSQPRESMLTRGLSDRRYRCFGLSFFYEIKAEDGQLTPSQHAFLLDELANGALAACGGLDDLQDLVAAIADAHGNAAAPALVGHCEQLVRRWAEKGYRREVPSRKRRRRR